MSLIRHGQPIVTNVNPHNSNKRFLKTRRRSGGGVPVDPRLAFHALEGRQGVIIGEGGLTATHTATIYAPDAAGVYQPFAANEPVWEGVDWLKYQPAATNAMTESRTLNASGWWNNNITKVADQVGIDGTPATGWTVQRATGTGDNALSRQSAAGAAGVGVARLFLKKQMDAPTRFPRIYMDGATNPNPVQVNLQTGDSINQASHGAPLPHEVISVGDYWVALVECDAVSGQWIWLHPDYTNVWGGDSTNEAIGGPVIVGQVEMHYGKTIAQVRGLGPIFTTTAAASTDSTTYAFEDANVERNQSAWYWDWQDFAGSPALNSGSNNNCHIGVNGTNNAGELLEYNGRHLTHAFAPYPGHTNADFMPATPYKWGICYSLADAILDSNFDGAWLPAYNAAFTGLGSGGVDYVRPTLMRNGSGKNSPAGVNAALIRNLRRYNITSYAEGKEIIDGLMA